MNVLYFNSQAQYDTFVSTGSIVKDGVTYNYDPDHDTYYVPGLRMFKHTVTVSIDKTDETQTITAKYEVKTNSSDALTLADLEKMSLPNPIPEDSYSFDTNLGENNIVFGMFAFYGNSGYHSFLYKIFADTIVGDPDFDFIPYEANPTDYTVTVTDVVTEM